jgi:hypothetical protein
VKGSRRFLLLALCATAPLFAAKHTKAPAIDPEWDDRGSDTTQPQWYRKHPFWTHIQKPFHKECDSIVARLKDSVPATPDTVVRYPSGKVETYQDSVHGKGLIFVGRGLILRPQLLRSSPYQGSPVGMIRPEDGPWRVLSLYRPEKVPYPPKLDRSERASFSRERAATQTVDRITPPGDVLKLSFPGFKALVAAADKRPLGWIPVDSIALFADTNDANVTAPFYQDGIAAFVHGAWKEEVHSAADEDTPDSAFSGLGDLHIQDMIHLWSITLRDRRGLDVQHPPEKLRHCLFHQMDEDIKETWYSSRCIEKADSFSLSYFYEEAGWERIKSLDSFWQKADASDRYASIHIGIGKTDGEMSFWLFGFLPKNREGLIPELGLMRKLHQ